MRRCILFFQASARPPRVDGDGPADAGRETTDDERVDEICEKRITQSRDWSAVFLAALRFLQLAFFAFAYCAILDFHESSTSPGRHGPWQSGRKHWAQAMNWAYVQTLLILIYHTVVLAAPCVLRILRPTDRPFTSLATVFGDGIAAAALLNTIVLLDTPHERYCHSPPGTSDFQYQGTYRFGRTQHGRTRDHLVCKSLDVVLGLGAFAVLSYLPSVMVTIRRARRLEQTIFAKFRESGDVEQGTVRPPNRLEEPPLDAPQPRQHSPPPPYYPGVLGSAQEPVGGDELHYYPRDRRSMETTSSLGANAYLVSDGWRPPEQPPDYSSRPPSLHNTPS
ncbi:hypothetical protein VTK26DRAFT_6442 [Humicola hyalothermophila]